MLTPRLPPIKEKTSYPRNLQFVACIQLSAYRASSFAVLLDGIQ